MLTNIILYLLNIIQYQYKIIGQLFNFICKYIPLKQWAFDDSHSPKYQKFKIDKLPKIISYKQEWDWNDLIVNAISLKPTVVSVVMHHFNILCGMMARNNRSFYAKYVSLDLNQTQTADSQKLTF